MKIRSLALILAVTIGAGTGMNGMTVCADNIPVPAESKGSLPTYTGSIYSLPIVSEDKIPDILDVHDIPKRGSAEASVPRIKYIDPSLPSEHGDKNEGTVKNKKSSVSEDECVASENAFTESADDPEYVFAEIVPDPVLRQKIAESSESAIAPDAVKVTQSQLDQVVELYAEWPGGWTPGHYDASGKVRDVTGIHYLRNVDTIYLCDNDLDQTDTTEFRDLKKLNYLDVTGNRLTDIPDVRGCVSFVGGGLVVYDNNIPQEKFSKEHIRSRISEKINVESIQEQMYEQVYPNESKTLRIPKVSYIFGTVNKDVTVSPICFEISNVYDGMCKVASVQVSSDGGANWSDLIVRPMLTITKGYEFRQWQCEECDYKPGQKVKVKITFYEKDIKHVLYGETTFAKHPGSAYFNQYTEYNTEKIHVNVYSTYRLTPSEIFLVDKKGKKVGAGKVNSTEERELAFHKYDELKFDNVFDNGNIRPIVSECVLTPEYSKMQKGLYDVYVKFDDGSSHTYADVFKCYGNKVGDKGTVIPELNLKSLKISAYKFDAAKNKVCKKTVDKSMSVGETQEIAVTKKPVDGKGDVKIYSSNTDVIRVVGMADKENFVPGGCKLQEGDAAAYMLKAVGAGKAEIGVYTDEKIKKVTINVSDKNAEPENVENVNELTLKPGSVRKLGLGDAAGSSVVWKSSSPLVLSVRKNEVTARKAGEADLTAYTGKGIGSKELKKIHVKVTADLLYVSLNTYKQDLTPGKSMTLKAAFYPTCSVNDDVELNWNECDETGNPIPLGSDNAKLSVAGRQNTPVSENGIRILKVQPSVNAAAGDIAYVKFTVKAKSGSLYDAAQNEDPGYEGISRVCRISIVTRPDDIQITNAEDTFLKKDSKGIYTLTLNSIPSKDNPEKKALYQLTAEAVYRSGQSGKTELTWNSANNKIARVAEDGTVTALKPGNTWIKISCAGVTKKVRVVVKK